MLQGCDSKGVRRVCVLGWIDSEGFRRLMIATGRASIGDLRADSGWHPNRSRDYSMKVIECQLVTE